MAKINHLNNNLKLEVLRKLFFDIINDKEILREVSYKAGILKQQSPPLEHNLIYDEFFNKNSLFNKIAKSYLIDVKSFCNKVFYHVDDNKLNDSIQPWHFDNIQALKFFIYLTNNQLGDRQTLSLGTLQTRLSDIRRHKKITHIDLYGGEIALLSKKYLEQLLILLKEYSNSINIITNFSAMSPILFDDDDNIFFS